MWLASGCTSGFSLVRRRRVDFGTQEFPDALIAALCSGHSPAPFRQRLVAYRTHAASVLQYFAQELPKLADAVTAAASASIASSPEHDFSATAVADLRSVGAPVRFETVRTVARAAVWRVALRLDMLGDIQRGLTADTDADEALLARRPAHRESSSVLTFMLASRDAVVKLSMEVRESASLQRQIVRFWADAGGGPGLQEWVRRRAGHLVRADLVDGEVDLAIRRIRWAFTELPVFVAFASMRALANAWCTSRRLSAEVGSCIWGCAAVGADDLCHYLACPLVFSLALAAPCAMRRNSSTLR